MGRSLAKEFMQDLTSGFLNPLLVRIREDDTLMLGLRGTYVNVYYRGGSILRLERTGHGSYDASFDKKYETDPDRKLPELRRTVTCRDDTSAWVGVFKELKEIMNRWFAKSHKSEREFQQLVAWENNRSPLANETEYFITDIEFADPALGARFDMLGLKWLADDRRTAKRCRPVLIEMKYGDAAIGGRSGIQNHLDDAIKLLHDKNRLEALSRTIIDQFNQLSTLGMLNYTRAQSGTPLEYFEADRRPELIFLLANHNPRSRALADAMKNLGTSKAIEDAKQQDKFDLRFFVSAFAGYGMHASSMVEFAKFNELIERFRS